MSFISRNRQAQAQAVQSAPPPSVSRQVGQNYGGVPNSSIGAVQALIPKVTKIGPSNPIDKASLQGGGTSTLLFEIPQKLGKVIDLHLEYKIQLVNADSNAMSVVVIPSSFFQKNVLLRYGSKDIETVEAEDMFLEDIVWKSDTDFANRRSFYNVSSTGGFTSGVTVPSSSSVTKTWYCPLNANAFGSMQPYVKGFKDGKWSFELTFANTIVDTCLGGSGGATDEIANLTVNLLDVQLYATEAMLTPDADAKLQNEHMRTVIYKTVCRKKWNGGVLPTVSNSSVTEAKLVGLSQATAAVNFFVRDPNPTIDVNRLIQHYPLQTVSLVDEANNKITMTTPAALLNMAEHNQVPIASASYLNNPINGYLLSFCSNLHSVLETGEYRGALKFTGQEKLEFQPVSSLSSVQLYGLAYEYAHCTVSGGNMGDKFVRGIKF